MRRVFGVWIIIILSFCLSFLDTGNLSAATDEQRTLTYDNRERSYRIFVPTAYDPDEPVPLLIALHPAGGDAQDMASITGFNEFAEREGFIVLYPIGPFGYWDYGAGLPEWDGIPDLLDDPGYLAAVLEKTLDEFNIDQNRIYAAGFSNGARMAYRLACELNLAAIATVAATISDEIVKACPAEKRVSVVYIQGTDDQVIPWGGKPLRLNGKVIANALSAVQTVTFWALQNQCELEPEMLNWPDADPNDRISVGRVTYTECDGEAEVVLYGVRGGGHSWVQSPDLNTSEIIWAFFATHARQPAEGEQ